MTEFSQAFYALETIHQQVSGSHAALGKLYPVAIAQDDTFLIFDVEPDGKNYHLVKKSPVPMPIPKGVRAAFQLADYDGRIACVVTPEVFDSPQGFVTILHEFVHCYQYETCEQDLKMTLDIARRAQEQGDFMWEIQHPFPYRAKIFTQAYQNFLGAVEKRDNQQIKNWREELKSYLGVHDFEYMIWQEWKEGFARWLENHLQQQLGFPVNMGGLQQPYSRVLFYAGGAAVIDYISRTHPGITDDLPALFHKLAHLGSDDEAFSSSNC